MNRMVAAAFALVNACVPKAAKQVVFCSFPDYSDNARAVYEEMVRSGMDKQYRITWLLNGEVPAALPPERCCRQHSLKGMWRYFRAKYVFHTHGLFNNRPPKRQTVVSLWHGMPLKTIMKLDATHPADEVFCFTYTIATSPLFQDVMARAFGCSPAQCLLTGQPRNDALFEKSDVLAQMGIDRTAFDRLFLWMPTYRRSAIGDVRCDGNGGTEEGVAFLTGEQLAALNAELVSLNSMMLIKLHPMQVEIPAETRTYSHIRFLRKTAGLLYHLVGEADALLTDCSSVYMDYLMLDRPIGFVFDDMAQYEANRGFVFDRPLEYMPGKTVQDYEGLTAFLHDVVAARDTFGEARRAVNEKINTYCDNNSSARLLKEVFGE
ncbi:MAG: hypothetical protein E7552_05025 [Ruminococcaceae bacterium]|nr:hypothetical protein [Oscillospiraceae bacterium]